MDRQGDQPGPAVPDGVPQILTVLGDDAAGATTFVCPVPSSPFGCPVRFLSMLGVCGLAAVVLLGNVAAGQALEVTLERVIRTEGHTSEVFCVARSGDRKWLVSGGFDRTVRLWDVATGRNTFTLAGHTHTVNSVAVSPDGRTIASGSGDGTVRLWDIAKKESTHVLQGNGIGANTVAFSPDGAVLAEERDDGMIRLWDVATGRERSTLSRHEEAVSCLAFRPDGQQLASGGDDHAVLISGS